MTEWRRHGDAVIVSFPTVTTSETADSADDASDRLWSHLSTERIGVAAPALLPGERRRVLSLVDAYIAIAIDRVLPLEAPATLTSVWDDFSSASPSFRSHVVTALHFRRLGWRLRRGLNYGAHFVLYRGDPDVVHSEYIVYVHAEKEALQWPIVQSLTRLAEDVKKTVVLCEVQDLGTSTGALASRSESSHASSPSPEVTLNLTSVVHLHGREFQFDGIMIRFWDVAAADDDRDDCCAFAAQPVVPKQQRRPRKTDARSRPLPSLS
ncbi:hypothetical protein PINS_up003068 [Pythium insidiosum]|nr:hypothetical protein PINS_up003068 [Pythium insidiosum]